MQNNEVRLVSDEHFMNEARLVPRREFLMRFHNKQLSELQAHRINLLLFEGVEDKEVIDQVQVKVPGTNDLTTRSITAGDQKKRTILAIKGILNLLKKMEEMLEAEGVEVPEETRAETKELAEAVSALDSEIKKAKEAKKN